MVFPRLVGTVVVTTALARGSSRRPSASIAIKRAPRSVQRLRLGLRRAGSHSRGHVHLALLKVKRSRMMHCCQVSLWLSPAVVFAVLARSPPRLGLTLRLPRGQHSRLLASISAHVSVGFKPVTVTVMR
ncbi:hypothetical protein DCS_06378 [Drechmeria coniospora]|uniref:Uncharacterized protein n=1 Tax=Drechmeria coniospora TaxID=98403 RepID=A0A151GBD4_DRECN|nr:hypothetical protein DCS_06378 [Drechmeria coniospora]KYK54420.1 hypothetical protein DCS_06378 [Drechmeria coniospora]